MNWLKQLFSRRRLYSDLSDEIQQHLEEKIDELIAGGMSKNEATYAARRHFGNLTLVEQASREVWRWPTIESFFTDVQFGLRMLRKNPGFTAVAVLTLALGIGANTAIFSLVEAVILKTLPVSNPQELILFSDSVDSGAYSGNVALGRLSRFTYESYEYFRDHDESFQDLCAFESDRHALRIQVSGASDGRVIQLARGKVVSGSYFSVLGVKPIVGRLLVREDDQPGAPGAAVMSYAYWHSSYNDDPSVVGRTLEINGAPFTIVGVAAPEFYGESTQLEDLWFPLVAHPQVALHEPLFQDKTYYWLNMMGRLRPGVTMKQANAAVNLQLRQQLQADAGPEPSDRYKRAIAGSHVELVPGARGISFLRAQYSKALEILMVVVGLVLLISCANVANLLLSRGAARAQEMSVRLTLGASGARLVRQLLTEGLLLSSLGGIVGILAAKWGADTLFVTVLGKSSPVEVLSSRAVLVFTLIVSTLSGILFGLAPALSAGRSDLSASMKGAGRPKAISFSRGSANALVVFQIAMALPLLIVCGLFARTLENLMAQKLGFSDDQVLVARINPHVAGYTSAELPVLYQTLLSGLSSLPGVVSCTFDATTPLGGSESAGNISFQGSSKGASGDKSDEASAHIDKVGERYFETLGTPILLGRDISPEDIREKRRVAVINQTMARQYFGKSSPLGQRYSKGSPFDPNRAFEIVGVSADARYYSLRAAIPATAFDAEVPLDREASLILRVVGNPTAIRAQASKRIGELATRLPPVRVVPLRNQVEDQFQQDRAVVDLSSVFGGFALVLASIGLYGTMSYRVSRRTNEIGVRMALGAQRSYVLWLVMRESAILVAFGLPTGALLALASTRLIRSQLFGLSPSDPFTIVLAASVLAGIAMIAGYIPARRAMKVDPMVALRYE